MKIIKLTAVMILVLLAVVSLYAKEKTVEGELVDVKCYMGGAKGETHQMCAIACAKSGLPVGVAAKDGKVYNLLVIAPGMAEYMTKRVKITGEYHAESQSIKPTKILVKEGRKWTEVAIPKTMM